MPSRDQDAQDRWSTPLHRAQRFTISGWVAVLIGGCAVQPGTAEPAPPPPAEHATPAPRVVKAGEVPEKKVWLQHDKNGKVTGLSTTMPPRSAPATAGPAPPKPLSARDIGMEVKRYILEHARDPDSVIFVKWHPIQKTPEGYYLRCQYRTHAGSFGSIDEDKVFFLNHAGKVYRTSARTPGFLE